MPLQATSGAASYDGFGGGPAAVPNYIEDVFSTWLYTGNGSTQTITNGIDLSGKGGLVWIKERTQTTGNPYYHTLFDTNRGPLQRLRTSETNAQDTYSLSLTAFNSNGFSLGAAGGVNAGGTPGLPYVSWTFRKQPKFFDVVTWTGTGSTQTINHSLGSAPGCIIVKRTDSTSNWRVYHRSLSTPNENWIHLNTTDGAFGPAGSNIWNVTSTTFQADTYLGLSTNGATYVAYLFAHNAGGFGLTGTDNVISCGAFTSDGSGNATVNLGYEPQWVLYKRSDSSIGGSWHVLDSMRGLTVTTDAQLLANTSDAETTVSRIAPSATGFYNDPSGLVSNATYIYIAIRRGPMKTPTTGTSVFYPQTVSQADTIDSTGVPFPPDLVNTFSRNGSDRTAASNTFNFVDRLRGLGTPSNTYAASGLGLTSRNGSAEFATSPYVQLKADSQNITRSSGWNSTGYGNWIYYFMRRAPGFFDVVCYTGTGYQSQNAKTHALGVTPELIIVKSRNISNDWMVYNATLGKDKTIYLNWNFAADTTNGGFWGDGAVTINPTASVFYVGDRSELNSTGNTYVAYLFASCPGVSKVGTYTGNGSSQTINCGFTGGARFVLIKRTNATGDWVVFDSARGIVAGNDPFLELNTTAAEQTGQDAIDPDSTGFVVNQTAENLNVSGGTYIYLAIA